MSLQLQSPQKLEPSAAELALIREGKRRALGGAAWESACASLLTSWESTIVAMARRYAPERSLCPDFAQVARMALIRAAARFQEGDQHRFEHYARRCLRHALIDESRRVLAARRTRVLLQGHNADMRYHRECGLTHALRAETCDQVRLRVQRWVRRLQILVDLLFHQDLSQAEAARHLGVTPARVSQLVHQMRQGGQRDLRDLADFIPRTE